MPINRRFLKPSERRPVFAEVPGQPQLKRFIGFEGDPGTENRAPSHRRQGPPNRQRFTGFGALSGRTADRDGGDFPAADGSPGGMNYDERYVWGTNNPAGTVVPPTDPSTAISSPPGPQEFDPGLSIPFGVSVIKWRNPTTMQSVPILPSTPSNVPVLSLNMSRNALVIQNNSTATSPDIAPNFYIGFNAQPQAGLALTLAPLAGLLFDIITPRDAIYVLIAGGSGLSQIIQGVVVQGTYAPL